MVLKVSKWQIVAWKTLKDLELFFSVDFLNFLLRLTIIHFFYVVFRPTGLTPLRLYCIQREKYVNLTFLYLHLLQYLHDRNVRNRSIHFVREGFSWVSKEIRVCFGFAVTTLYDWLEKVTPLSQPIRSETKAVVTYSHVPRVSGLA